MFQARVKMKRGLLGFSGQQTLENAMPKFEFVWQRLLPGGNKYDIWARSKKSKPGKIENVFCFYLAKLL